MTKERVCLTCGAPSSETYVSARLSCRACALDAMRANVNVMFDVAEGLGERTDPGIAAGIERSVATITANRVAGQKLAKLRNVQRKATKARLKSRSRAPTD